MFFKVRADGNSQLNTAVTILQNSNVGIGTSTPDTKLAVNGTIHTKEVKVDLNGWSDYVFKPSYHLPSLSKVKNYINLNHHLPEIPSEKEIAADGLNLGDMDKVLTKKIEELTLYLIEKDKQLNDEKLISSNLKLIYNNRKIIGRQIN